MREVDQKLIDSQLKRLYRTFFAPRDKGNYELEPEQRNDPGRARRRGNTLGRLPGVHRPRLVSNQPVRHQATPGRRPG